MLRTLLAIMMLVLPVAPLAGEDQYTQKVLAERNVGIKTYAKEAAEWDWDRIKKEGYKSANGEFKTAIDFLYRQDPESQPFIKFFTTYAVPHALREKTVHTLSFALHSMVAFSDDIQPTYRPLAIDRDGEFIPYQLVPGTDTLWWIDIRDFGWTNEAFEKVVLNDGYFVQPITDERLSFLLEAEQLSPNLILRADWFIRHGLDSTKQTDKGLEPIYELLLYARLVAPPANEDEWRALWGGNSNVFTGVITDKSAAVAKFNRGLFNESGRFGEFYESFDTIFQEGQRDYIDDLFNFVNNKPRVSDAGEFFAFNQLGLLVYTLRNADGLLVDFADPSAARHPADILDDVRVRIPHSCMDCHAGGPIRATNSLVRLLKTGTKIRVPDFDQKADLEAVYLSGGFEHAVEHGSARFAKAMLRVNGLTPQQNMANYLAVVSWYERPVDLVQAAVEVGLPPEVFAQKIQGKVGARLAILINGGNAIPRDIWDSAGVDGVPGAFQQAAVVAYNLVAQKVELNFKREVFVDNKEEKTIKQKRAIIDAFDLGPVISKIEKLEVKNSEWDIRKPIQQEKLVPVPKTKTRPFTHIFIDESGTVGWRPNTNTSDTPHYNMVGPATWPIARISGKFVAIRLSGGETVWLLSNQVQLRR